MSALVFPQGMRMYEVWRANLYDESLMRSERCHAFVNSFKDDVICTTASICQENRTGIPCVSTTKCILELSPLLCGPSSAFLPRSAADIVLMLFPRQFLSCFRGGAASARFFAGKVSTRPFPSLHSVPAVYFSDITSFGHCHIAFFRKCVIIKLHFRYYSKRIIPR